MSQEKSTIARIRALNDCFRQSLKDGEVYLTKGIAQKSLSDVREIIHLVQTFDAFSETNDPYLEHDFGAFTYRGNRVFWKIDAYDKRDRRYGAQDPSDPKTTARVLTIMLASEY